ncbi:MAG: class I SAM-dependent RNA methyltransferase [Myxococcales bacterium]
MRADASVRLRVTSRKSKLYHTEAIAQRLREAIERKVGLLRALSVLGDDETEEEERGPAQLFVVRAVRDTIVVSADSSGEHLHRRGYRQAVAKAPLRETLAAAMLLGSGWRGETPLVDPMCGSGTIPIEAAMIARRMAPGRARAFAFERWPEIDSASWARLREETRARELTRAGVAIRGSDRDAGAIDAARSNAERAEVSEDVEFAVAPLSATAPDSSWYGGPGAIVTNPPYGIRVGEAGPLRDLYAALGRATRDAYRGWRLAVLSPGPELEAQIALEFEERFRTTNGGIPVRLVVSEP